MSTTEKTIDAVGLMREIRERMSREMEGMSKDEILRYLNEGQVPTTHEKDDAQRNHAA
ncbi:MAG TPA: hypothetical protein VGC13_11900 [Longimicrobium sp.]|jgi:hypothetical protein|uniref:hypothetical protein n=1 Tax=Longimicrobium sp. TaxID=2029185 RepID=UPI002EDA869E